MVFWKRPAEADAQLLERLGDMPSSLIFIMGCHRSGTSLLYHLLSHTEPFDYISAYDIVKYDELLHNRIHGRERESREALRQYLSSEKNRGLDNLPVDADTPEEYRWIFTRHEPPAFILSGQKRIYNLFFKPTLTKENLDKFREVCRKKRFLAGKDAPLVLKNPNDFYSHFLTVHEFFPQAKFIFIHRHPLRILSSMMQTFRPLLEEKSNYVALIDPRYTRLFRFFSLRRRLFSAAFRSNFLARTLMDGLIRNLTYYLENIPGLPPDSYVSIRYEDLCAQPEQALSQVGEGLGILFQPRIPDGFVAPRNIPALDLAERNYRDRLEDIRPYLKAMHYPDFPT